MDWTHSFCHNFEGQRQNVNAPVQMNDGHSLANPLIGDVNWSGTRTAITADRLSIMRALEQRCSLASIA
jgi:hypothetical protein